MTTFNDPDGEGLYPSPHDGSPGNVRALAAGKTAKPKLENAPGLQATGLITFTANPTAADSITLNGTVVTFVASGATGNQVNIGGSLSLTLDALVTFANGSADANIAQATYVKGGTTQLKVTAKAFSTSGNAYTLASTQVNGVVSGATLTGGAVIPNISLTRKINNVSVGAANGQFALANGDEGQQKILYLSATGGGTAQVNVPSFTGSNTKITFTAADQFIKLLFLNAKWRVMVNGGTTLS